MTFFPAANSDLRTQCPNAAGSNFPARQVASGTQWISAGGDQTTRQGQSSPDTHGGLALPGLDHPDGHTCLDNHSTIAVGA